MSSSEVVALLVESFGLLAQVLFVDHVGPSGRQVLVLCAECVEVPRAAARSGFLLHHTFGEHGHLDGPSTSGHRGDHMRQRGRVGMEAEAIHAIAHHGFDTDVIVVGLGPAGDTARLPLSPRVTSILHWTKPRPAS